MVVYLDVEILMACANLLFDYLLLWATAAVSRKFTPWYRLAAGAMLGTAYYVFFTLAYLRLIPGYGVFRSPLITIFSSGLMLGLAFWPVGWRQLSSLAGHFYMIGFIAAGSGFAGAQLLSYGRPQNGLGMGVAIVAILVVAEVGWGVVREAVWRQNLQMPLEISLGERTTRVSALLDTGNRLHDPLSGQPVIVAEAQALSALLPQELATLPELIKKNQVAEIPDLLTGTRWSARFRLIPFNAVGGTSGMLVGIRPDAIRLWSKESVLVVPDCIIALSPGPLAESGTYTALIGPDVLERSLDAKAQSDHSSIERRERMYATPRN